MKITLLEPKEYDAKFLRIDLSDAEEEVQELPADFPLREGDKWNALLDIDTRAIVGFPTDYPDYKLDLKPRDAGSYTLYDADMNVIGQPLINEYVPGCIPGSYGDYLNLNISKGIVTNWNPETTSFQYSFAPGRTTNPPQQSPTPR